LPSVVKSRVVLDTNVFVPGLLLPESITGKILKAWRGASFDLVLSEPLLEEIRRVLGYRKIRKRLRWDDQQIGRYTLLLRFFADVVDVTQAKESISTDPKDAPVLATFLVGKADYLVSGDDDLIELRDSYSIVTPAEFWQRCG
jgi:uncharacterized protein